MTEREQLPEEREGLLEQVEQTLETPLILLGFVWLAFLTRILCGAESVAGRLHDRDMDHLHPGVRAAAGVVPEQAEVFQGNWLTAVSLVLPALRALERLQSCGSLSGGALRSIVGSLNRGMSALRKSWATTGSATWSR